MEIINIIIWSAIAIWAIGFMFLIKPLADLIFPLDEKYVRPTWLCKEED